MGIEPQRRGNTVLIEHMLYASHHGWNPDMIFHLEDNLGGCHCKSHFADEVMTSPRSLSCEMDQTRLAPTVT